MSHNNETLADETSLPGDRAFTRFQPLHDPEQRRRSFKDDEDVDVWNVDAVAGMPDGYAEVMVNFVRAVAVEIKSVPLKRKRFYVKDDYPFSDFPFKSVPVSDKDVNVSLAILPRPGAVEKWLRSPKARKAGWLSSDQAFDKSRSLFGQTVIYEPGAASEYPLTSPATPYGTSPTVGLFVNHAEQFLKFGKLVRSPMYHNPGFRLSDDTESLRIGENDGAKLLGRFRTTLVFAGNSRLRWVKIERGKDVREFLAYALVDGNGAIRSLPNWRTTFVRPLTCLQHQPRLKQHDELLLPTPLPWPPRLREFKEEEAGVHEDWCLDDWFPVQKDACWVIREAEDSNPLQESFLLMPASEKSNRPVFFIALFAETEPKRLVKELAALHKVSPDTVLNSPETMARLNSLYEKVRDFPLGK